MEKCDLCRYDIKPDDIFNYSGSKHRCDFKSKNFHKMCGNITESYFNYIKEDLPEGENIDFSPYDVIEWVYEVFCDDCGHRLTEEGEECRLGILDCRIIRREFSDGD